MMYLAFALQVLVVALLAWELHGNRKERQSLALLIKSRDVQEFVRAEQTLALPREAEKDEPTTVMPFDLADPNEIAESMERSAKPS